MGFSVILNGEKIHEVDVDPRLVTGVRLMTAAGEAGVGGSPLNGLGSDSISLILDIQQPNTLPMIEDDARLAAEEDKNEVTTYNVNAQREAAIAEVDAEYAKKSADDPEKDYTEEYQAAREAAATGAETAPTDAAPTKDTPAEDPVEGTAKDTSTTTEKATMSTSKSKS